MSNVWQGVDILVKAIHESTQYQEYEKIKLKVYKDEEAKKRLNEFRNQRFLLESQKRNGLNPSEKQMKDLHEYYAALMMDPNISSFIQAEIDLSQMLFQVYKNISDSLDFHLE